MKAEKRPASLGFSPRSMICAGLWSGTGGRSIDFDMEGKDGGISEFMKRFNSIRTI